MLADVQFTVKDDVVVATLSGEVDTSNAAQICNAILETTPNHALGVVLDLSAVDYLDSAGIHLIYSLRTNLQARGQLVMLVIPAQSPVQGALRLAGVTTHLPMSETADAALLEFKPRSPSSGAGDSDRDAPQGEPAV
jgi:anti-anti-sigma factor